MNVCFIRDIILSKAHVIPNNLVFDLDKEEEVGFIISFFIHSEAEILTKISEICNAYHNKHKKIRLSFRKKSISENISRALPKDIPYSKLKRCKVVVADIVEPQNNCSTDSTDYILKVIFLSSR